jgi:anaerobic magnesium-protoporphyrin IX monomethyl ester cyclase
VRPLGKGRSRLDWIFRLDGFLVSRLGNDSFNARESSPCENSAGGPHCLIFPRETLLASEADFLIAGDGEDALLALAKALQRGEEVGRETPGLWCKKNAEVIAPISEIGCIDNLDALPFPDRTLLPYKRYSSVLNPHDFETTMITSRGCPHRCVFCKMTSQKVSARSSEKVVEEFCAIHAMGISDIQVYDDTFTWSKKRVMEICQGILDNKLDVHWAIRDRVNKADAEMYALMKKAGCYRIHFGVESGSPPVLKASGKGITLPEVESAVALAMSQGFTTMTYYMFGFLDETLEDAMKTIQFAVRLDADYAVFAVLIPYPGTELYRMALERGIIASDFWLDFAKRPVPDFEVPRLIEQNMTRQELIALKDTALRKYYFRPSRLFKELWRLRSGKELLQKAGMAWNIVSDSLHLQGK